MASKKLIYSADFKKTLHEKIKQYAIGSPQRNMLYAVLQWLDKEPRIDAESVRHGRWLNKTERIYADLNYRFDCSVCSHIFYAAGIETFNYCPNCGAKMDGDVNG